jgi:hypothetical protein
MFWLLVMALWAAMLLSPFLLLFLFLPGGRDCPRCAGDTIRIRSRLLRPIRGLASRRWCLSCGWEGMTRNVVIRRPLPTLEVVPDEAVDDDSAPWRGA